MLLFMLSSDHGYAGDLLTQITARMTKSEITQGDFQQEKRLKILRKPLISTVSLLTIKAKALSGKP